MGENLWQTSAARLQIGSELCRLYLRRLEFDTSSYRYMEHSHVRRRCCRFHVSATVAVERFERVWVAIGAISGRLRSS